MCVWDSGELYTDDTGKIMLIFMRRFFFQPCVNTPVYCYEYGSDSVEVKG